jgi:hypothetical protein
LGASSSRSLCFQYLSANWRQLVAHPEIDIVSITEPNSLHKEMSHAAITAGKRVFFEEDACAINFRHERDGRDYGREGGKM